jgi:D-alanyl-D-alanine carboxypeptidase
VVSPDSMKELLNGVDASKGRGGSKGERHGLAVQMRPSKWGITYGHDGWFPGYLTQVLYYLERRLAIALQINSDNQRETTLPLAASVDAIAALIFDGKDPAK